MSPATGRSQRPLFPEAGDIDTWVFDLDNTLYPAACDLFAQIDVRMTAFVSDLTGLDAVEARRLQKLYYAEYGTTLAGLMHRHSIDPQDFLDVVHDIDLSVLPDLPDLRQAMSDLPGRKLVYTNGPRIHATRIVAKMGLTPFFDGHFGIEDGRFVPKPKPESYAAFLAHHGVDPARAIFFEDMPRNLAPAKALGFATVLVHSDKDWSHEPVEARPASGSSELRDDEAAHIDYVTGDLTAFLSACILKPSSRDSETI